MKVKIHYYCFYCCKFVDYNKTRDGLIKQKSDYLSEEQSAWINHNRKFHIKEGIPYWFHLSDNAFFESYISLGICYTYDCYSNTPPALLIADSYYVRPYCLKCSYNRGRNKKIKYMKDKYWDIKEIISEYLAIRRKYYGRIHRKKIKRREIEENTRKNKQKRNNWYMNFFKSTIVGLVFDLNDYDF